MEPAVKAETTMAIGRQAESVAAQYLVDRGYALICRNWRRRTCEIDLVVGKNRTIYFVEVKYRRRSNEGSGVEYVTTQKLKRMAYAAQRWVQAYGWKGAYVLSVIEVSGADYQITNVIEDVSV